MLLEPLAALAEHLRVGNDAAHLVPRDAGDKVVFDAEMDLGADAQAGFAEEIQGVVHRAFGGVLDGHHPVIGPAFFDLFEHIPNGGQRNVTDAGAEFIAGGLMAPGAFGAEAGDGEIFLQGERCGHDFPVNGADGAGAESALAAANQGAQELFLAFGDVDRAAGRAFDFPDFVDQIGAAVEQIDEFGIIPSIPSRAG